jgi:hypothetical protein
MTATRATTDPPPLPLRAKASLGVEVAAAYLAARRSMRRGGLREAIALLRTVEPAGAPVGADPVVSGRRLGRAVLRTLAFLPGDTRCLAQSLTLTRLLARRGIASSLVIGVRAGERFAAHAWVEHDGVPLLPRGSDEFEELVTL